MMFIIYIKKKNSNIEFSRGGEHLVATMEHTKVLCRDGWHLIVTDIMKESEVLYDSLSNSL